MKTAAQPQRASTYRVQKSEKLCRYLLLLQLRNCRFLSAPLPCTLLLSHPLHFEFSPFVFGFLVVFFVNFHCALQLWKVKTLHSSNNRIETKNMCQFLLWAQSNGKSQTTMPHDVLEKIPLWTASVRPKREREKDRESEAIEKSKSEWQNRVEWPFWAGWGFPTAAVHVAQRFLCKSVWAYGVPLWWAGLKQGAT